LADIFMLFYSITITTITSGAKKIKSLTNCLYSFKIKKNSYFKGDKMETTLIIGALILSSTFFFFLFKFIFKPTNKKKPENPSE